MQLLLAQTLRKDGDLVNAHCRLEEAPSQPVQRFLISTTVALRVLDPKSREGAASFLPEDGPLEALASHTKNWLVLLDKSYRGFTNRRWLELWEDTKVEIQKWNGTAWEEINANDLKG